MRELEEKKREWVNRHPTDKYLTRTTNSGIPIDRLYMPMESTSNAEKYIERIGFPGEPPFVRGIDPDGYLKNVWRMIQYAGRANVKEMNRFLKQQLADGVMGLNVAVDLPNQVGLDSDHPLAQGEVGKVGVPVNSLRDMEEIFDGIDVCKVHISMQGNSQSFVTLAFMIALAEKQGGDPSHVAGFFQNDVLKEFIARGTYIYPVEPSVRLTTDVILYSAQHQPKNTPQVVCEYHMAEAGASIIQSAAMALGNAIAYADWILKRGGNLVQYLRNLFVFISVSHDDFFEEIARVRALRRIWYKLWKERYGVDDPECLKCRFVVFQPGSPLTAVEPENNITRTAISILAAAAAGVQSIGPRTFDEALGIPSDKAITLSLKAQQIVAYETGVINTIDPLGGSFYIEHLTDEIEKRIWDYLAIIESKGGMINCISSGWVQNEIATAAYERQKQIDKGEKIVIGVNKFPSKEEPEIEPYLPSAEDEKIAIQALKKLRQERDSRKVNNALQKLKEVARTDDNIIPATVEAVRNYATVGEICGALRDIFGEFTVHI